VAGTVKEDNVQRRLTVIAVADVVGYARLMEGDEAGTLKALKQRRKTILEPMMREHGGRLVKVMGDGVLIEFASAVSAVEAAVELQRRFAEVNEPVPEGRRIVLRIGINLGDVIGEGSDIYGEGVNIASRLNPNLAWAWTFSGWTRVWLGEPEVANLRTRFPIRRAQDFERCAAALRKAGLPE
jgi:class 3 adenylate cyclase